MVWTKVFLSRQAKKNLQYLLGFSLRLFGHSGSRIVHCAGPHPPRTCFKLVLYNYRIVYAVYVNSSGHYYEYIGSCTEQLHTSNVCTGRGG